MEQQGERERENRGEKLNVCVFHFQYENGVKPG